jgi:hypothetical protein
MKELLTSILKHLVRGLGVVALFSFASSNTSFADNISKTFEFGEGTPQSRSHVRTFPIPCNKAVAAVVKFRRLGPDGGGNDIPIIIELREPDTAADQEGSIVQTESGMAKTTEQTVTFNTAFGRPRGCSLPWRVRVRHANAGTAPSRVFGTIRLDFDDRPGVEVESVGSVQHQGLKIVNIKAGDIKQGKVEITANWYHFVGSIYVVGPNPIKLKIRLIDPNGRVVKTVEAYSGDELRSELPKFKLTYQVVDCLLGQWKLDVFNNTNDDARFKNLDVKITLDCP